MARARNTRNRAPTEPALDVQLMNGVSLLIFAVAALVLAAALVAWLTRASLFTIRSITLETELARSNLATLRASALPKLSGNFFSFDLDRGRAAFESVPWVRRAVVRRVWPNGLAVALEEHQPAALWQGEGGSERLVNSHGEVFDANLGDVEEEGLVTLSGPQGSSQAMLGMQRQLAEILSPIELRVETLRLSSRGSWRAELDSGATIELGRGLDADVAERAARFVRTLGTVQQRFAGAGPRALLAADLRHPDGYALRLRGVSTTSLATANPNAPR